MAGGGGGGGACLQGGVEGRDLNAVRLEVLGISRVTIWV